MSSDPDTRGAMRWKRCQRCDEGTVPAVSAGAPHLAQRPTAGSRCVGAPGALPGRSQNVGRSLGIEGVRALARALSLSCASQALAYVSVLQSVAFSIFANTVCAAKRPPLQRFAAFERRNRASVVLRGQHSADIMLLEEKKELVAKSTRGVPDFLRRASCSGISPHSALTLQLFVAASKLLQSDTGTRELMS